MESNIPYIYNYCDRWCERCAFTARCAVHAMTADLTEAEQDPQQEDFWQRLAGQFTETQAMLEEGCAKWGIDLQAPTDEEMEEYKNSRDQRKEAMIVHPLIRSCDDYAQSVEILMAKSAVWIDKGRALAQETNLGLKTVEKGYEEIDLMSDCGHVISWYQHFIGIKFRRALDGLWEDPEEAADKQSDVNGSAKAALLAADRSHLALRTLFRFIPDEDRVLPLLGMIERIGRLGRETFPAADQFVRPGFDEIEF